MTLWIGDHLRIERNGILVQPESEAYHEYVVLAGLDAKDVLGYVPFLQSIDAEGRPAIYCDVRLRVVK